MSSTPTRAPIFDAARLRGDFFPWVLALATGVITLKLFSLPVRTCVQSTR